MCRFLAYKGESVLLADLLTRPYHSLIKQSYCSKLRPEPLNGDGFGLGWYNLQFDDEPGLFTSLTPAWANRNLERLAEKLRSSCFFAHVRAATPGLLVSDVNCHPFKYKNLLWMHNGNISEFLKIKRELRASLSDDIYNMIQGTTDSEHAFGVFLDNLPNDCENCTANELVQAMKETLSQLKRWSEDAGIVGSSNCNFAVTDGQRMVITRYATHTDHSPESLYYIEGEKIECIGGTSHMKDVMKSRNSLVVSSEPLTEDIHEWEEVPANSIVIIDSKNNIQIFPL
jgi:glutamine amidotransferase